MSDKELLPLPASVAKSMPSYKKIHTALTALNAMLDDLDEEADQAQRADLTEAARFFVAYHRLNEVLDRLTKRFSNAYDLFKTETLPNVMESEGQKNVPLSEGFRVTTSSKLYASIRGEKKEEAYRWLIKNGLDALIVQTVNASTLSAAAKVRLEEEFLDLPAELFNSTLQNNVSVTRTKS